MSNQEIHDSVNKQYLQYYEVTLVFDYEQVIHVLSFNYSVTMQELHDFFSKCEKVLGEFDMLVLLHVQTIIWY